jgi:hypothetical protein
VAHNAYFPERELRMTKANRDGLYFVLLGIAAFLLIGSALENAAPVSTVDFRVVYYSARCILKHHDPYLESELQHIYQTEGGETAFDTPTIRRTEMRYNYLPTAFFLTVPFAVLPFWPAHILWLTLTAGSFILASLLMWNIGEKHAPVLSGGLVFLLLANGELFLVLGNPAGIAVSLCVIAVWCFVSERLVPVGVVCLAVSLMLKPHDAGLVWLYFLLAGRVNRKRALSTLLVAVVLSLPAILWITDISPHWAQELHANLIAYSAHGDINDPGPASMAAHGIGMIISLQTIMSIFRDDPRFYNPATYLVCGALLVIWLVKTVRSDFTPERTWFALAPIAALSMLPIYHRIYDAKLLLLTIPACAMLWEEGGPIAWVAILVNSGGILLTGGIPWAIFLQLIKFLHLSKVGLSDQLTIYLQVLPVPLILLVIGVFYLLVYVSRTTEGADVRSTVVAL